MSWLEMLNLFKKESGKTTEQISLESKIPRGTLNKLFAGQTKDPQYTTLLNVVHCLGKTIDDLAPIDDIKKAPPSEDKDVSDEAMQIANAYDTATLKDKNTVRVTLGFPLIKEDPSAAGATA